jgi:hypothetical protein
MPDFPLYSFRAGTLLITLPFGVTVYVGCLDHLTRTAWTTPAFLDFGVDREMFDKLSVQSCQEVKYYHTIASIDATILRGYVPRAMMLFF